MVRCVNLLQFDTRWFYWFRFSTLCNLRNLGNLSQTIANRFSNVGAFCPTRATGKTCYEMLWCGTTCHNVSQFSKYDPSYPHPCQFEQFQHLSQVLPDESFLQNWFSAWYDFFKIVAGCSNVQTVPNWFTPASVCATFADVHSGMRNLRAWRKMNQFVSTDLFRHTVLTTVETFITTILDNTPLYFWHHSSQFQIWQRVLHDSSKCWHEILVHCSKFSHQESGDIHF